MAATLGTVMGVYQGTTWATAFKNPSSLDIIQVLNEGGKVVWSLNSAGTAFTNPTSVQHTVGALNTYFGSSLATAFKNSSNLDILQIYTGTGETLYRRVNYAGTVSSS